MSACMNLRLQTFVDRIVKQKKATDLTRLDDVMALESVVGDMFLDLRRLHNQLAPVHKLPGELLCAIFEFSSYDYDYRQTHNAIAFSHVCQRWRDTVISFPLMWAQPDITPGSINLLMLCLERSQNTPLNVTIEVPEAEATMGRDILKEISLIAEFSERISSITINAQDGFGPFLQLLNFAAPMLQRFSCTFTLDFEDSPIFPVDFFGGHMPNLRVVDLEDVNLEVLKKFSNLTELHIRGGEKAIEGNGIVLLQLLERSPLLERLSLTEFDFDIDSGGRPLVHLEKLVALSLIRTNSRTLLSCLEAPNLEVFEIIDPNQYRIDLPTCYLPQDPSALTTTKNLDHLMITDDPVGLGSQIRILGQERRKDVFRLEMETANTEVNAAIDVWNYLSTTCLTSIRNLTLFWPSKNPTPPADAISAFFANIPSLYIMFLMYGDWDVFLQPLIENVDLCPQLGLIVVNISPATFKETFRVVELLVRAREKAGKLVLVEHMIFTGANENLTRSWDTLCAEHGVRSLE